MSSPLTRLSKCHWADVFQEDDDNRFSEVICSYCGKRCEFVSPTFGVDLDIELTLRRWKDGDCSLDEMFDRLTTEQRRDFRKIANPMKSYLQKGDPEYIYSMEMLKWLPTKKGKL